MKKKLLAIVLIFFAFVACTNHDDVLKDKQAQNEEVRFKSFVDRSVRGKITDNTVDQGESSSIGLKDNGFGVFGFYTDLQPIAEVPDANLFPNFMYNQKVIWNDLVADNWGYAPAKYWSNIVDSYYSFFAYAPYTDKAGSCISVSENDSPGTPKITYNIPESPLNLYDLVCAQVIDRKTLDEGNAVVDFYFNHQLTRLSFDAKTDAVLDQQTQNDKTYIVITDLKVLSSNELIPEEDKSDAFYRSASYTFGSSTSVSTVTDHSNDGVWDSFLQFVEDYSLSDLLNAPSEGKIGDPDTGYDKSQGIVVQSTADAVSLFKDNEYLFLIPPNGNQGITELLSVNLQIVYDIVTEDSALMGGYTASADNKAIIHLPEGALKQGRAYKFTLTIGLDEVDVSAQVVDWDEQTNSDVDV